MSTAYRKFVFLTDLHYGFERRSGHKVPLHDMDAWKCALTFCQDFKPDVLILGGDILDCSPVSHHTKGQPGKTEGLRLLSDAKECQEAVIKPLEALKASTMVYITGNHERFLTDLTDVQPELEGIVDLRTLLGLSNKWELIPQGGHYNLGKLTFIHGDQLGSGEHVAKKAVTDYERSIRFGHTHSFQAHVKCSPIETKLGKSGILVPCICRKDPSYMKGKASKWVTGFLYGIVFPDGTYNDTVAIITNGRTWANGKVYQS